MYGAPRHLSAADLPELVHAVGGPLYAQRLLGVSQRTLRRWLATCRAPICPVRLLWYASHWGRAEAAIDIANELRIQAARADALQRVLASRTGVFQVPAHLAGEPCANAPSVLRCVQGPGSIVGLDTSP